MKILIMGLPGSGKSTFAETISKALFATRISANQVREKYDDWDFSTEGRIRQSHRMKHLSDGVVMAGRVAIADFICPTEETRREFDADFTIWMSTIDVGKYEDTNNIFTKPKDYDKQLLLHHYSYYLKIFYQLSSFFFHNFALLNYDNICM